MAFEARSVNIQGVRSRDWNLVQAGPDIPHGPRATERMLEIGGGGWRN